MKVFVAGATGFIGGSVAETLVSKGYEVSGLVRTEEKANYLAGRNIKPVLGELSDGAILADVAKNADVIINAASSDHRGAVEAILEAIRASGKTFIQTSGSSIVADASGGEASDIIYDEENLPEPIEQRKARVAIDNLVRDAARDNIRSIVICPTMIYGRGRGFHASSDQIPRIIKQAKKDGVAKYIGKGLNRWSNVHIDDLVDLYLLAVDKAKAGDFFFAENGEQELKAIAEDVGKLLGFNPASESWSVEEAIAKLGEGTVLGIGSNSRVRAVKARKELGWEPKTDDLLASIKEEIS